MKKILSMLGALAGVLITATATAGPMVTQWSFAETLAWTTATFSAGGPGDLGTTSVSSTTLSWGATGGSFGAGNRSGLDITNANVNGSINTNGAPAVTNTITHYNNPIAASFQTLLTANLLNTLILTPTLPNADPSLPQQSINFAIHFKETTNAEPCGFPHTSVCDDIFVIDLGSLNNSFTFDGNTYFVSIFSTTNNLIPLDPLTCAAANAAPGCLGFQTQEGQNTPATFAFEITSREVTIPEPSQLALLAIGLLGLYFIRGRRSQKL